MNGLELFMSLRIFTKNTEFLQNDITNYSQQKKNCYLLYTQTHQRR